MSIISFILLISSVFILSTYKKKCSEKYNMPAEFFEIDVVSKFSFIALLLFLAILLIVIKPLDGVLYSFSRVVCYFFISILFIVILDKVNIIVWIKRIFILCIIKFLFNAFCHCTLIDFIIEVIFIIMWIVFTIKKLFLFNPLLEDKYKIVVNNKNRDKYFDVVISKFNGSYLIVKGIIKGDILELNTQNYEFVNPMKYKLVKIENYKKIIIKNINENKRGNKL